MFIRLEDLKAWKAKRIQDGNCNYDDMLALGVFIEECEKYDECQPRQDLRQGVSEVRGQTF